jgi:hypothetical protein
MSGPAIGTRETGQHAADAVGADHVSTYEHIVSPVEDALGPAPTRAQALPFGGANDPSPGRLVEVALLTAPTAAEPFVLRAPRGALVAGVLFGLRFLELGRLRLCLVRALEVSRPVGLGFDLVGAQLVRPIADEPRTGEPVGEQTDIPTLETETSIRLVTLVVPGEKLGLLAAPGRMSPGICFGLRYFDHAGAKYGLVRVHRVRSRPGLLDEIEGELIGTPTRALERESYRAHFDLHFTGELVRTDPRLVVGRLTDLSADGVGIDVNARLEPGDRIRIGDLSLPGLNGEEVSIVRRDRHESTRHGARFVVPNRGLSALATLLGLAGHDRPARHELRSGDVGRRREAIATPLSAREARDVLGQRIG